MGFYNLTWVVNLFSRLAGINFSSFLSLSSEHLETDVKRFYNLNYLIAKKFLSETISMLENNNVQRMTKKRKFTNKPLK